MRVRQVFEQALEQPPDRRRDWLSAITVDDPDLRREVEALMAAHDAAGDFLDQPPDVPLDDVPLFPPGTVLGSYAITRELGRGGGGIVYLAEDRQLGRQVALKLVAAGAGAELRERLRREARAAATITHSAIATIYSLEEFDDQLFIVSEYVNGRTLRAALAEGLLPRERILAIAREMASALRAAHDAGVIHRDLKPENVLLAETGAVKIVDFGIARVADERLTRLTRHGAFLGTPAYMAPEQLLGTSADARADIYAFGIVLTEMIAGRHPGMGSQRDPISSDDDSLTLIARRCTQLDPAARFQTAERLVEALQGIEPAGEQMSGGTRWWWEFHQAMVSAAYGLALWPAWLGRVVIGGSLSRIFFMVVLAAVVISAAMRLHLWFMSHFYPEQLSWVRKRSASWIAVGDAVFAVSLVSGGLLIRDSSSSIDVVLLAIGLGAAVGFLIIEPATTRAAFGSRTVTDRT